MAPRKDWNEAEKLFRLGQLSAAEIGRQIGASTSTVTRHMAEHGITQDTAAEVRRRTRAAIATQRNNATTQETNATITEEDINDAVKVNIALVMEHRKDLQRLKQLEDKLLTELEGEPTKLYLSSYQGVIVEKVVGLTVTEKSATLLNLSAVRAKRIDKQLQAFGIGDKSPMGDAIESLEILLVAANHG